MSLTLALIIGILAEGLFIALLRHRVAGLKEDLETYDQIIRELRGQKKELLDYMEKKEKIDKEKEAKKHEVDEADSPADVADILNDQLSD